MAYWKCPACGFEAQNDKQKQEHTTRMANDAKHAKPSPGTGGQPWGGKNPSSSNPWQQGGKGQQKP
jgi:hypothetical protein